MSEKCLDIGTIQAFLDGELALDRLEAVSQHIALCDDCAISLAEAEEESALAFSVLEQEFNTFVPTNRLRTKINDSIEKEKKPFWQTVFASVLNPSVAAFAGLVIVVGLFVALLSVKTVDKDFAAGVIPEKQNTVLPISKSVSPTLINEQAEEKSKRLKDETSVENVLPNVDEYKYEAVKTGFSKKITDRQPVKNQKSNSTIERDSRPSTNAETRTEGANLLGEESYAKTIAALTKTVNGSKDEVLKPAARFAFERDLAVTDDAIKKMKAEVAKNPKNEAAKDVLRASYQNKIDLLNTVAEKSELMASLK